jgi:hypothetical protein
MAVVESGKSEWSENIYFASLILCLEVRHNGGNFNILYSS